MPTPTIKNTRKMTERRLNDRRHVEYEFNSPQWLEYVQLYYVAWPRFERRESMRRKNERRDIHSKTLHARGVTAAYSSNTLTAEEKLFFDNLFSKGQEH